jgi:hypothetical protein
MLFYVKTEEPLKNSKPAASLVKAVCTVRICVRMYIRSKLNKETVTHTQYTCTAQDPMPHILFEYGFWKARDAVNLRRKNIEVCDKNLN